MDNGDGALYFEKQDRVLKEHEALCRRCGICCGATGSDPCSNLAQGQHGEYFCKSYVARLGIQFTVSGQPFTCVPIRDVLCYGLPHPGCGYSD